MSEEDNKDGKISDLFKKVVTTGIGAAFMTEDAIRSALSDLPVGKEVIQALIQNAKSTKEDFVSSVKIELRKYLSGIDPSVEIEKVLDNYDIEMNATFRLTKKNQKKETDESDSKSTKKA